MGSHDPPPLPILATLSRAELESLALQLHSTLVSLAQFIDHANRGLDDLKSRLDTLEKREARVRDLELYGRRA